jgi:hypothetical protein
MHATQLAYAAAKAQYDTLYADMRAASPDTPEDVLDRQAALAVEAHNLLRRAEDAMLNWAHSQVMTHPLYRKHTAEMQKAFGARNSAAFRPRLVDIAFRFKEVA